MVDRAHQTSEQEWEFTVHSGLTAVFLKPQLQSFNFLQFFVDHTRSIELGSRFDSKVERVLLSRDRSEVISFDACYSTNHRQPKLNKSSLILQL